MLKLQRCGDTVIMKSFVLLLHIFHRFTLVIYNIVTDEGRRTLKVQIIWFLAVQHVLVHQTIT